VSLKDSNQTFDVKEGEIIYDALYERGLELPHGCLSGSCGACRIEVMEGADLLVPPGAIETDTINAITEECVKLHGENFIHNKTIRLSCRAKILGDILIRPIK
jgi:ferredoxin